MTTKHWTASVRVGTPNPPEPRLYAHLPEKERMIQGWPNDPMDPQLLSERVHAQKMCARYNETKSDELKERQDILDALLHPSCKGKKKLIKTPFCVDYGDKFKVGDNFYADFGCLVLDSAIIEFGDNCILGPNVHIYSAFHPLHPEGRMGLFKNPQPEEYYELAKPIKVGSNCWIGGNAILCPGITVGDNVVIGAGAVVTKDVPSNVVVGGNPAKIVRFLDGCVTIPSEILDLPQNTVMKLKTPSSMEPLPPRNYVSWCPTARVGTRPVPSPSLYANLSEKEKMMKGLPYRASNEEDAEKQRRSHVEQLYLDYNETTPGDQEIRQKFLDEILHESCRGKKKLIEPPFCITYGDRMKVGENFFANFGCVFLDTAGIEFGENCLLAPGVQVYTSSFPLHPEGRQGFLESAQPEEFYEVAKPIKVGSQCWIGGNAILCPGITIGDNVVIGAGAVITKDVPSNVVVGGNPAKIIRYLDGADVPPEVLELQKKYEKRK